MRKRCVYCRRLFDEDPRQKGKQKTCGSEQCKLKRRCENARRWRAQHPGYDTSEYRRVRHRDRREWRRRYWASQPEYREHHRRYMRHWRERKKQHFSGVRIPYPEIEVNCCREGDYLKVTGVRIPYPVLGGILRI